VSEEADCKGAKWGTSVLGARVEGEGRSGVKKKGRGWI